jgi:hypothetical protein
MPQDQDGVHQQSSYFHIDHALGKPRYKHPLDISRCVLETLAFCDYIRILVLNGMDIRTLH